MLNSETASYLMPAEWEKHSAVWLAWPYDPVTFPERVEKAEEVYIEIIKAIAPSEKINLLILNESVKEKLRAALSQEEFAAINFFICDYADVWIRDYGPTFLKNSQTNEPAWVKWKYNAYGSKFPDLLKDNEVFLELKDKIGGVVFEPEIFMEGGAIEVNGKGILITTEQCLLNKNRNPQLNRQQIEQSLIDNLGVQKIIWLKEGIVNDHTDGHVDDVVKFVSANKILCAYENDQADENYQILKTNCEILQTSTDQEGNPFEIVKLPMPHLNYDDGSRAPASYANFYIGNGVVLVPTFNDENDQKALEIIQSCFSDRKIVAIDCSDIIYGGGTIHCITQQQPL